MELFSVCLVIYAVMILHQKNPLLWQDQPLIPLLQVQNSSIKKAPCPQLSLQCLFFNPHTSDHTAQGDSQKSGGKIIQIILSVPSPRLIHHPPESSETPTRAEGQHPPSSCSTSQGAGGLLPAAELLPSGQQGRQQNMSVFKGLERPE